MAYRTQGGHQPAAGLQLRDVGPTPTLEEQLEAIGSIDHDTEKIPAVNGNKYISEEIGSYFPRFFLSCRKLHTSHLPIARRPRLCHFALNGDWYQVQRLFCMESSDAQPEAPQRTDRNADVATSTARQKHQREPAARRPRFTAEDLELELGVDAGPVLNMASVFTPYRSFIHSVIMEGCLLWVKHERDSDVFVINGYGCESSEFLKSEFVFVEVRNRQVTQCQCEIFRISSVARDAGATSCLHSRFVQDHIVPLMGPVQEHGFQPTTRIAKKLLDAWSHCNLGCVRLGEDTSRVVKFCVRARDESVSFVHLSRNGSFVRCLSGECSVRAVCKKKLQGLETSGNLCPHLDIFKAHRELWGTFAVETTGDNAAGEDGHEENIDKMDEPKDYFNRQTGLWDFEGKSTHQPTDRSDPRLKR